MNFEGPDFKDITAKISSYLVRKYGPTHIEAILDSIQEAFFASIKTWPIHGVPNNQIAWLTTTAERRLIDHLRRIKRESPLEKHELISDAPRDDDELKLYLMVCSPQLKLTEQVCLMLRLLGGLTAAEIAYLLHESEEAVQRRITRAKAKLEPDDLAAGEASEKVHSVLVALYLMFTEGYEASRGDKYLKPDLAYESLRLTRQLNELTKNLEPDIHALISLMCFNLSRLPARIDSAGLPILLQNQDQTLYDQAFISAGFRHLEQAQLAERLSRYHLEAGLAAAIATNAPVDDLVYWHQLIVESFPTPMARLSLAIAIGLQKGGHQGINELNQLQGDSLIGKSPHYHAARAYFYNEIGEKEAASGAYKTAISLSMSQPIRQSLEMRDSLLNQSF